MGEMREAFLLFQQSRAGGDKDALFPPCCGALELETRDLSVSEWPESTGRVPGL